MLLFSAFRITSCTVSLERLVKAKLPMELLPLSSSGKKISASRVPGLGSPSFNWRSTFVEQEEWLFFWFWVLGMVSV